jgi:dTDP-glucose pyrophosphorylase
MVAIIPAAGRGVRMASVTAGAPKELLDLGGKPVLLRVLDEARQADPDQIVVVSARDKEALNAAVERWSKAEFADLPVRIAYQETANGLAGAVAAAECHDDALVLVGDCAYSGGSPAERMASLVYRGIDGCIAVQPVGDRETSLYGIVEIDEGIGAITGILEKPEPDQTSSRWAVAGRFAFAKPVMGFLAEYLAAHGNEGREVTLTEVIQAAIAQGIDIRAVPLAPGQERHDCGSPEEYEQARRARWD